MEILNSILSWVIKKRIHQIDLFLKYPHEVQAEWLKKLLHQAKNTEWGKQYDYQTIHTPEQFKERVPLGDYNSLKPYINRLQQGEQNILWSSEIKWFAKSSGTTDDKSKFIPVSQESLEYCHYKGGKDLLSIYCNNHPDTKIFDGRSVAIAGSRDTSLDTKHYYGDLSAIMTENLPLWFEFMRTPSRDVALMDEWETKIEKMAQITINQNVTNLAGVPSWTLLLLKKVLELSKTNNLLDVWPNLELFVHGGVSFESYRDVYQKLIPSSGMNYLNIYNATEGFFGIQDTSDSNDMLLMLDYGIYYEFIPMEEFGNETPKVLSLAEVKLYINYALVISTNAGLWRYVIGDTVMFTNTNPYRIRLTGRTKSFINVFGEELIVTNAEKALSIACEKTNSSIAEFTVAPMFIDQEKNGAHEWLIEFEVPPKDLSHFTELLDNALKSLNSDYEAKRSNNLMLRLPIIKPMPRNTFYNWMKQRGRLGGQHKVPRLHNTRKYVDEILQSIHQPEV